jgi:hypothetical protein
MTKGKTTSFVETQFAYCGLEASGGGKATSCDDGAAYHGGATLHKGAASLAPITAGGL